MDSEFQESLDCGFDLMKDLAYHNLFITRIDSDERRNHFWSFLDQRGLRGHQPDSQIAYDYVLVQSLKSPIDIYNIYNRHNGHLVIFDTEKLLSRKQYLDIAEGGFCSSPDDGSKWPVRLDGKKEFLFTGHVIILSNLSKDEMKKKKDKFFYVIRDMQII